MNNLPSDMRRHTVFRDNDYSHTIVFEDGYPLPTPDKIKMQVRYNGRVLEIDPEVSVSGQRVTYTYTPEMLAKVPSIVQQYLVLDGKSFIGGELGVLVGYGEQDISETQVTVVEGEVTVVEVMGLSLVTEQVGIATEKAAEASTSAAESSEWAQAAGDFATTAGNAATTATSQASAAENSATAAVNAEMGAVDAQQGAEAAKSVALAATQDPLPETFAAMKAMLIEGVARQYTVQHDEFQGADEVPYYFNGQRLFAWGVAIDDEEQPTFN